MQSDLIAEDSSPTKPRADSGPHTTMRVTKRNGSTEPVDLDKIVRAVQEAAAIMREASV